MEIFTFGLVTGVASAILTVRLVTHHVILYVIRELRHELSNPAELKLSDGPKPPKLGEGNKNKR